MERTCRKTYTNLILNTKFSGFELLKINTIDFLTLKAQHNNNNK